MKARARKIETTPPSRLAYFAICGAIVVLIGIVFGQTLSHDFVNYDDKTYVYGNPLVSAGLSIHGLSQALVDTQTNNWHPLTLVSHMIDCQLYDLKAGGHHFTNVLLHTIAAVLLFFWLRNITGRFWCSAFVTALFAIHPLRVEPVAWIAERKDVLSAVFFFLTLGAYVRYARVKSFGRYLTMSILFACGLMSKPMLVTTPAVLLLIDYWPLNRDQRSEVRGQKSKIRIWLHLVAEKLPLFALSAASSLAALALQVHAAAFLIAMTWVAFTLRRNRPYLLVGWLWYLIMLLPVIGIVEVGLQGHADRYTYLPHVGLYIALAWLVSEVARSLPHRNEILAIVGGGIVIVLSACAWKQTTYWRSSETLWTHTLAVTTDNDVALTNLGTSLMDRGQLDDALSYFHRALAVRSRSEHSHYNLSLALIHDSDGNVLARKGRLLDAVAHFRQAIEFRPDYPDAHYNLGTLLFQSRDLDGAIAEWRITLSLHPNDPGTNANLGNALVQKGLLREAATHYEVALQSEPDSPVALNNLAWLLSAGPDDSLRNGARAVELARNLTRVSKQNNPFFIRTLAAAYAEAGQFDLAIETAQGASELANAQGQHSLAIQIQDETDLYRQHLPFRDRTLRNAR